MLIKERDQLTYGTNMTYSILDRDSFVEMGAEVAERETDIYSPQTVYASDGVVTGYGTVNGRPVFIFCQDRDTMGGTFGISHGRKIINLYKMAIRAKAPVIGILDSAGFRVDQSVDGMDAFSALLRQVISAKKEIIQIMVKGSMCIGSMKLLADTGDFVFDVKNENFIEEIRSLISILPCAKGIIQRPSEVTDDLNRLCIAAKDPHADPKEILADISDDGFVQEVRYPGHGGGLNADDESGSKRRSETSSEGSPERTLERLPESGILTSSFIRLNGMTVGALTCSADENGIKKLTSADIKKAAWFVRLCDSLHLSLVILAENDGLCTDKNQEEVALAASELAEAMAEAAMPKVTVITGKVTGQGYILMGSRGLGADAVFAWPDASVELLNPRQAIQILEPDIKLNRIEAKSEEYEHIKCDAHFLLARGYADKIIAPEESRKYLIGALEAFSNTY